MYQNNSTKKISLNQGSDKTKLSGARRFNNDLKGLMIPANEELTSLDAKKIGRKKISFKKGVINDENENLALDSSAAMGAASEGAAVTENAQVTLLYAQSSTVATDAPVSSASASSNSASGEIPTAVLVGLGLVGVAAGAVAIASSNNGSSSTSAPPPSTTPTPAKGASGTVADGNIKGSRIFIDTNKNGVAFGFGLGIGKLGGD